MHIALVGKYVALHDAYLSVVEALTHGGIENDVSVKIRWVDSEAVTDENADEKLSGVDGVLVPGGFGDRGIEGMICRRALRPGEQDALLRHLPGDADGGGGDRPPPVRHGGRPLRGVLPDHPHPVIALMPDQVGVTAKGGTMRLGSCPCRVTGEDTFTYQAYGSLDIAERHRHRYEFNNQFREALVEAGGLTLAGLSPDGRLVEIVERHDHPWFVGVQFHPELKSRPNRAHPSLPGIYRRGEKAEQSAVTRRGPAAHIIKSRQGRDPCHGSPPLSAFFILPPGAPRPPLGPPGRRPAAPPGTP